MQALILNGALVGDDGLDVARQALSAAFVARGWTTDHVQLREKSIAYCKGCFDCWAKTPGRCPTRDDAADVTRAVLGSHLLVLLSPVTFGGYSSEIKKALDRSICLVSPFFTRTGGEVHHQKRYPRYPSLLGVGVTHDNNAEEERIFSTLVARNALNLHAPRFASGFVSRADSPERVLAVVDGLVRRVTEYRTGAA
jgi:multimeric flavodoxin WrbA